MTVIKKYTLRFAILVPQALYHAVRNAPADPLNVED